MTIKKEKNTLALRKKWTQQIGKVPTAQIRKENYDLLENHRLFPEKQKGCLE